VRTRDPLDLRQQHGVETPEQVEVRLELAGVGSRTAALTIDLLILIASALVLLLAGQAVSLWAGFESVSGGWAAALYILLVSSSILGYFGLFEALNGGRTPGKQVLGIRVVMDTGQAITANAAVVRSIIRIFDCFFPLFPFLPAFFLIVFSKSNKRLGDMAAGTIVVRDRPTDWVLGAIAPPPEAEEPVETGPPELTEDEFRLLDRFLGRINELDPAVQTRLTFELARRFENRIPRRTHDVQGYLVQVFAEEQMKRRGRFATRARPGAGGARGGGPAGRITVTAERFVAKKRESWEAFRTLAVRMERSGVGALAGEEIPAFAARYREVAADLARAHTYGVDPRVIEYLERVVSAGHNALYRARGRQPTPLARYVLRDFPAAVVQSWAYVLVAFVIFIVPAVVGYVMIRQRPALAEEIVRPVMVSRAEEAAQRQAEGRGYAETEGDIRPILAAGLITNNIRVSLYAFAGGLTLGLYTAWVLFSNGMELGLGFGLFKNYGVLGYLTTFIAGHGVLELTAIFISAGAGFRLAHAIIAPGDRTRRDALVVEGRVAVLMVGAVVTLLVIAGAIEGLLSASDAPAIWKYSVSLVTAVFLVLYFTSGWMYRRETTGRP